MSHATILIVEDNEMNQRLLVRQLARLGIADVAIAANGAEGLAWLEQHTCRLVLADCQMPVMDGYDMTRRIRAREAAGGPRLPVLAFSAGVLPEDRTVCTRAGMDGHIAKPVQLEALQAALQQWLGATVLPPR